MTASTQEKITPIKSLNMYVKKWTIKGRITSKSDKLSWQNNKGNGTLFNIVILDESNENIRATFLTKLLTNSTILFNYQKYILLLVDD